VWKANCLPEISLMVAPRHDVFPPPPALIPYAGLLSQVAHATLFQEKLPGDAQRTRETH
jgi:hypothetical protein